MKSQRIHFSYPELSVWSHARLANFWYASLYFSPVFFTTSLGNSTSSFPLRPLLVNQSRQIIKLTFEVWLEKNRPRKYCLSKLSCGPPTSYVLADQKRLLSGVKTSSINTISSVLSSRPNSNLVSAMMIPQVMA